MVSWLVLQYFGGWNTACCFGGREESVSCPKETQVLVVYYQASVRFIQSCATTIEREQAWFMFIFTKGYDMYRRIEVE